VIEGKCRPDPGRNECAVPVETVYPTGRRLRTFQLKWRTGKVQEIHCEYITEILSLLASQDRLCELEGWREK